MTSEIDGSSILSVEKHQSIAHITHLTAISIPFLYTSLLSMTMLTVFAGLLREGSGVNFVGSTAFGIVDTMDGWS
jgi:hypothetical protein